MPRLPLAYSPSVPAELLDELERAGRRLGLPLGTLEDLGRSEATCRAFVLAARRGDLDAQRAAALLTETPAPLSRARAPTARTPATAPRPPFAAVN